MSSVITGHSGAVNLPEDKREAAAAGSSTAAIIYGVFLIISLGCCVYAKRNQGEGDAALMLKPVSIEDELMADASRV
jgi:hypothetical protein